MNSGALSKKHINKANLVQLSMVQALVEVDENTNRVLNIVKAKHSLQTKGQAIEFVVQQYIEKTEDPELRPEFIAKMKRIQKQKSVPVKDFAQRYGLRRDV